MSYLKITFEQLEKIVIGLKNNIKALQLGIAKKINVCYGTCATAGDIAVKAVECPEFTLVKGAMIFVSFDHNNEAGDEIKLNVNDTGDKWISDRTDVPEDAHVIDGNRITSRGVLFIYDGEMYRIVSDKYYTTVDSDLNDSSGNPVANSVIDAALSNKADNTLATTSANGLMSAADKKRFDGMVGIYYGTASDDGEVECYYVRVQTLSGIAPEIISGGQPSEGIYFIQFGASNDAGGGFKVISGGISTAEIPIYNNKGESLTISDWADGMLLPFVCTGDKFILMLPDNIL